MKHLYFVVSLKKPEQVSDYEDLAQSIMDGLTNTLDQDEEVGDDDHLVGHIGDDGVKMRARMIVDRLAMWLEQNNHDFITVDKAHKLIEACDKLYCAEHFEDVLRECKNFITAYEAAENESAAMKPGHEYIKQEDGSITEKDSNYVIYDANTNRVEWTGDNFQMIREMLPDDIELSVAGGVLTCSKIIGYDYEIGATIRIDDSLVNESQS